MPENVFVLMDPIASINPKKDSSLAMLLAAQARGHRLHYIASGGLLVQEGKLLAQVQALAVFDDAQRWFALEGAITTHLFGPTDIVLSRKDPPFDGNYLHDMQLLDLAEQQGAVVVNRPQGVRDFNEKLATLHFPALCPPTVVSRSAAVLKAFIATERDVIGKVLDGMGGRSIFRIQYGDPNQNVILETLTEEGRNYAMLQRYLPQIVDGDKRVLVVGGKAVPFLLARLPQGDDFRGNLARGGRGEVRPIGPDEQRMVDILAPHLIERGLFFVGLDMIGPYLTEINVTSPTCIREIAAETGVDSAALLFDFLESRLQS